MPCSFIDLSCDLQQVASGAGHVIGGAAASVAGDFLGTLADGIRNAVNWLFTQSASWWVHIPSPDLVHEPAITAMRTWLLPMTAAVAVGGIIAAGLRMAITRRAAPLLDVSGGLAAIAAAATVGVIVPDLLLQAGDAWSDWILRTAAGGGQLGQRLAAITSLSQAPVVVVIIFGIFALVLGVMQAALLVFRQAAVIILAALLPLAAAGATAPLTRTWIRKLISWMLALIMYKPAAAAVYATAFTMMGKGADLQTVVMGFVMLVLSLLAMPVLMRFFTWTTGAVSSGSGGSGFLGMAAAGGVVAAGALRGAGSGAGAASASEHASYLNSRQSPGASSPSGACPAPGGMTPGSGGREAGAPGTGSGAGADGAAGTGTAAGPASRAASAATAATAGAAMAAVMAAGGLASGARNTAASATQDGERR